jgi:hypothetical protein
MTTPIVEDTAAATEVSTRAVAEVTTQPRTNRRARTIVLGAAALATPLALGTSVAMLARSRRAGVVAGGITAAAFAALRWQLQRWFTDEPIYVVERTIGDLEIRHYAPRVEAHTRIPALDFETALDEGFRRLAGYIFGGNDRHQSLEMTTPVTSVPRGATHEIAFVMPPGYARGALPRPRDERVTLVEIPARRIAALRFRGRYTGENFLAQTRRLHELVLGADLDTTGQPVFAGFDPPTTLPLLRRAEIWIELAGARD